jgi:hypothetical protein
VFFLFLLHRFECETCNLDFDHLERGICESCVRSCHANHKTYQRWTHAKAFCDCSLSPAGVCGCEYQHKEDEEDEDGEDEEE